MYEMQTVFASVYVCVHELEKRKKDLSCMLININIRGYLQNLVYNLTRFHTFICIYILLGLPRVF